MAPEQHPLRKGRDLAHLGCLVVTGSDPLRVRGTSTISRDEVAHLARLARLALTDEELDGYVGQLGAILGHVSQISAVSIDEVDAISSPLDVVNVTRPDVIAECLTSEQALAQAPRVAEDRFAVPQILGEEQ